MDKAKNPNRYIVPHQLLYISLSDAGPFRVFWFWISSLSLVSLSKYRQILSKKEEIIFSFNSPLLIQKPSGFSFLFRFLGCQGLFIFCVEEGFDFFFFSVSFIAVIEKRTGFCFFFLWVFYSLIAVNSKRLDF